MKVIVAHAKSEDDIANKLILPIQEAGVEVWHRGSVTIGNSYIEEATKALDKSILLVVCATASAVGSTWASRLISATRDRGRKVLIVQMDDEANVAAIAFGEKILHYWEDPAKVIKELIQEINVLCFAVPTNDVLITQNAELEKRYTDIALKSYDIIDLTNLPDSNKDVLAKRLELRQLYVPLRLKPQIDTSKEVYDSRMMALEKDSKDLNTDNDLIKQQSLLGKNSRTSLGERLNEFKQLVVLGDPGSGKTTLLRWLSTAYLLQNIKSPDIVSFPDFSTLPSGSWLPFIVRCRAINQLSEIRSHEDLFTISLQQSEIFASDEIPQLVKLLQEKLRSGELILLIDGLDEITDITKRAQFCEQIGNIKTAYSKTSIIVTSRIVGYREIGHKLRDFEHFIVDELTVNEKNKFASKWCNLTEPEERKQAATRELIEDIHSSDRIERLTGNPMLLTTLALVKQKSGRIPSKKVDLYWDAFEVLLNWRRAVDEPIHWREALPQLAYIAFEMCRKGIQRMRQDEVIELLNQIRDENPFDYDIIKDTPNDFLNRLEKRTGILIQFGYENFLGRRYPVYEFRHLTFQEYLAARALIDGYYPQRNNQRLSEKISPLAGQILKDPNDPLFKEESVGENWSETLRLCVSACRNEDVDDVLLAILRPGSDENFKVTQRPRAALAAFCLTEEPNSNPVTAEEIINKLTDFIRTSETPLNDIMAKKIDSAIKSLAKTRWVRILKRTLFSQLIKRPVNERVYVANLLSFATRKDFPDNSYALIQWLKDQLVHFELNSRDKTIETALSYWQIFNKKNINKLEFIPELTTSLIKMVGDGSLSAYVASSTLQKLNDGTLGNASWRPNKEELEILLQHIRSKSTDLDCVSNFIIILAREFYYPALDVILERLESGVQCIETKCIFAIGQLGGKDDSKYIIPFLNHPLETVKLEAIDALRKLNDISTIEPLLDVLKHSNEKICERAIEALKTIGKDTLTSTFISCVKDQRVKVKSAALTALYSIDQKKFQSIFLQNLKNNNSLVKKTAIECLSGLQDETVLDEVINLISDPDESIRETAIRVLLQLKGSKREEIFKNALKTDSNVLVQYFAAFGLIDSEDSEVVDLLIASVLNGEKFVKFAAASALNFKLKSQKIDSKLNPLLDKLKNPDNDIEDILIIALRGIKNKEFNTYLENLLNHKDFSLRKLAVESIGASGNMDFIDPLINRLSDEQSVIREISITELGKLKAHHAIDEILNCLSDDSFRVRVSAAIVLGELECQKAENALLIALDDYHSQVRKCAIIALENIASKNLTEKLILKVNSDSRNVKLQAIQTLGTLKDIKAYDTLSNLLKNRDEEVRETASEAVSSLAYYIYDTGNIKMCLSMFEACLTASENEINRNNAAFCALILGEYQRAETHLNFLTFSRDLPTFALNKNNKALQVYLTDKNKEEAKNLILEGLKWLDESKDEDASSVHALLILKDGKPIPFYDISLDAALLFNLYAFAGISKEDLIQQLSEKYPDEYKDWIDKVNLLPL